jgi:N-acyl-L-homoserine lactone synthetase
MSATARAGATSLAERIHALLRRVTYRNAETDEERDAIYRLRYEAYLREGAIAPSFGRRLSDEFDDLDNAWIVGVSIDGALVGSMRIHVATPEHPHLVAARIFPEYINPELAAGRIIVDPTRFVIDVDAARKFPELSYLTVRTGHMAAEHFGADIVLATVRAEHQAFYKRVFGHVVVCEPRPYLSLLKPLSLMLLDYPRMREQIARRYPFFMSTAAERESLFGPPPFRPAAAARDLRQGGDAAVLVG